METNKLKFGTIVVATDLSSAASTTLRYAQAIARFQGSTLVIVHVIDPVGYAFPDGAPDFAVADKAARDELRRIEAEIRDEGIQIHSVVETGVICERILQAVCDHHADLLVVGTGAKSRLGRVALGTVARQLLARTPCPILTVSAGSRRALAVGRRRLAPRPGSHGVFPSFSLCVELRATDRSRTTGSRPRSALSSRARMCKLPGAPALSCALQRIPHRAGRSFCHVRKCRRFDCRTGQ